MSLTLNQPSVSSASVKGGKVERLQERQRPLWTIRPLPYPEHFWHLRRENLGGGGGVYFGAVSEEGMILRNGLDLILLKGETAR